MNLPRTTHRPVVLISYIGMWLMAGLPFLVPFEAFRNIELQGLILICAGVFAWINLLWQRSSIFSQLSRLQIVLLGIFAACSLISLLVNPHKIYDLLGAPYLRLGTAGFLACIGCSLLLCRLSTTRLMWYLYAVISGLAWLSLPYSWLHAQHWLRLGGVFAQADIFACFVGCGLLLGFEIIRQYPQRRALLIGNQLLLAIVLVLSETRAVILLVLGLGVIWLIRRQTSVVIKRVALGACVVLLTGLLSSYQFMPGRFNDISDAADSVRYRLDLQTAALRVSAERPLFGYGPGNLADALDCHKLVAQPLQATCREGYFFNSSHNIFIDRLLAIGWLGGLAYAALAIFAIYKGWRGTQAARTLSYAALLIAAYYFTNVTSVPLELLFWILLMKLLSPQAGHDYLKK